MPSLGFYVILIMWLLVVVAPSIRLSLIAWRMRTRQRIVVVTSYAFLALVAYAVLTDPAVPDVEIALMQIMGLWLLFLLAFSVIITVIWAVRGIAARIQR